MKYTKSLALFIYFLTYLGIHMTTYAQSSGNSDVLLELKQTTPTPVDSQITPKVTRPQKNILTNSGISFTQDFISFGFLVPGEPVLRSDTLNVKTTHPKGASLFIMQDHPLQSDSVSIPPTSCDTGTCTTDQASIWVSPLTFGFGFRCENSESCTEDFQQADYYRPLSHSDVSPVLKINNQITQATVIYKLNIPASQNPLPYRNTATYILTPNL